jgi:hypothetical protein
LLFFHVWGFLAFLPGFLRFVVYVHLPYDSLK